MERFQKKSSKERAPKGGLLASTRRGFQRDSGELETVPLKETLKGGSSGEEVPERELKGGGGRCLKKGFKMMASRRDLP